MPNPFNFTLEKEPSDEVLIHQTEGQLGKNFAQTTHHVYELTDAEFNEICQIAMGTGNAYQGNWVPARTVTINGEVVLRVKRKGEHVQTVLPFTDI
ncbi:hypothetical protein D3C77_297140 [compost metagenome]